VDAPTMTQTASFRYADLGDADLQLLEMPYESDQLSMVVLLPRKIDRLAELEAVIDNAHFNEWLDGATKQTVEVYFPRFTFTDADDLAAVFSDLGMTSAFSTGAADFSGMDGTTELYIGRVLHKSFVDVAEEGTEAAAATAITLGMSAMPVGERKPPPVFRADHPFLFLIRDNVTGAILFIGRVADPR